MRPDRRSLATLLAACALALAGCGGSDRPAAGVAAPRPDWIANPSLDNQLGAVGIARRSVGGQQQAIDQAAASARSELARSLAVTVESSFKDAFTATSDWKTRANDVDAAQLAHELSENVTHQVTNQVLRGSRQRGVYTDAATGEVYVWVAIERGQALSDAVSGKAQAALTERGLENVDAARRLDADLEHALR